MSPAHLGVATLRKRLTPVLHEQVQSQLPKVVADLEENAEECRTQLQKIGPSRATIGDQRDYLFKASLQFHKLIKASIDSDYTDPFFGAPEEGYEKRLRAVVQNSLLELASLIQSDGRAKKIVDTSPTGPSKVSREEFLREVEKLISMDRGRELPGMYNPAIVGQLFRKQSAPWKQILD
ncbi:hypothetical protein IMZ48_18700 [Candidatus Bathyarchaeota archaeon]|nr:hypothetical protein [Candidatus Bathyarchaeota archaeon]